MNNPRDRPILFSGPMVLAVLFVLGRIVGFAATPCTRWLVNHASVEMRWK